MANEGYIVDAIDIATMRQSFQFIHPKVKESSFQLFNDGYFTQAVQEGIKALFEYIREKSGLQMDGINLIERVFNEKNPLLYLKSLSLASEKNERVGYGMMLSGLYTGVRNVIAHQSGNQIFVLHAYEIIVTTSFLCRKLDEATKVDRSNNIDKNLEY
ncbi:MAG: TIGR02391 family protein [Deltaproteobacteria bacterium]|nr:TIGR02391 family protein [Deltaproteobacteria bacterium]